MNTRPPFQDRAADAARWLCVASAFAVPLPAAWLSFTTGLFLIAWGLAGRLPLRWATIRQHPVGRLSLVLLLWMAVAIAWSPVEPKVGLAHWWHYRELLIVPLMLSLFDADTARRWQPRVFAAFFIGFGIALVTSFLRWTGVLPDMGFKGLYAGFGGRTGFSMLLAWAIFCAVEFGRDQPRFRLAWAALALVCFANLFFINTGRTGQIAFFTLVPLSLYHLAGRRGLVAGLLAIPVLAAGMYAASPAVRARIAESAEHIAAYEAGHPYTGDGLRLEFIANAADFIRQHPVFGGGTGSFAAEYKVVAEREGMTGERVADNPHNEYLMVWSQQGLPGLALLIALFLTQWRLSARLDDLPARLNRGLVLLIAGGDLVNSLILDNLEGHLWALLTVALTAGIGADRAAPSPTESSR